jgi:arylsulfatase A-like enzyme
MGGRAALREGNWKIHRSAVNRPWELYHLAEDPGEAHDLSSAEPARRQSLIATFERLDAEMAEPLWGGAGRPRASREPWSRDVVRGLGTVQGLEPAFDRAGEQELHNALVPARPPF